MRKSSTRPTDTDISFMAAGAIGHSRILVRHFTDQDSGFFAEVTGIAACGNGGVTKDPIRPGDAWFFMTGDAIPGSGQGMRKAMDHGCWPLGLMRGEAGYQRYVVCPVFMRKSEIRSGLGRMAADAVLTCEVTCDQRPWGRILGGTWARGFMAAVAGDGHRNICRMRA
ncbi:MAG TPA: hypothetical protein DCS07_18285 [Bdellovibrionales bacterium]|nr:hypothetical protein [Bdellovibrionales bacterium]